MNPLFASGDPFMHTWNTWHIDLFGLKNIDLRDFPMFEKLGITNAVVMMLVAALLLLFIGIKAGNEDRSCSELRANLEQREESVGVEFGLNPDDFNIEYADAGVSHLR